MDTAEMTRGEELSLLPREELEELVLQTEKTIARLNEEIEALEIKVTALSELDD